MLTKIIALPIAILIFPAYYRWYHRQERAKQRYASHRRFLEIEHHLRQTMRSWQDVMASTLTERLAYEITLSARAFLGTYQDALRPGPDGW